MGWIAYAEGRKIKRLFKAWAGPPHPRSRRFTEEEKPVKLGSSRTLLFPETLLTTTLLWRAKHQNRDTLRVFRVEEELTWKQLYERAKELYAEKESLEEEGSPTIARAGVSG